jgi:L-aminopeptidase/D-esterase-like protein
VRPEGGARPEGVRPPDGAITDVPGIEVGHATDEEALTGCTVVLCREGATAGVAVRGAAPGTRETDLCRPGTLIERVHAVLLTGGSAFGLEAAAGVMRHLANSGIGYDARGIRVPIVPGAVIFDLAVGKPVWPDAAMGERAAAAASATGVGWGRVGAGTGATIGKLLGPEGAMRAGVGSASVRSGDGVVGALAVVNAGGDVVDPQTGAIVAGTRRPDTGEYADSVALMRAGLGRPPLPVESTTLAVVACSVPLTVEQANHLASVAHDGFARTVRPVHTMHDGDTIFALAPGEGPKIDPLHLSHLGVLTTEAVERAVLRAVRSD